MSIEFRERPTMEHAFQLEVRKSGALIGHIRCDEKASIGITEGHNQLIYEFEDDDLDRLKQRVAAREETSPLTY
jgi:hypothetical protein